MPNTGAWRSSLHIPLRYICTKNLNFKYFTCNLFSCTSTLINLEYIPLNSLTTPYTQGQLQHMSVETLINFEDSMPKKSNSGWDSLYLFTKFSALTKYIFEKLNFSTNNILLVKTASNYGMPISSLLLRVQDFRNPSRDVLGLNICPESKMFIKRCIPLYFTAI